MTFADRPALSPRRTLRGLPWLFLAAVAALGCSGEILVLPGDGDDRPETGGETCATDPTPAQPDPAPLAVTAVQSGAFIGDTLHLEATVDGSPRYVVLSIDAEGVARAVAMPDELLGPANLARSAPDTHARLRVDEAGTRHVDVVDTSKPEAPALISSAELEGAVDGLAVFSAAEEHLFFCMRPEGAEVAALISIDLTSPAEPSPPQSTESFLCHFHKDNLYSALGPTWISWNQPTGTWAQQTYLYMVGPAGAQNILDYAYNQTGVHMYGNVLAAATSEERAVFDPENETLFLIADPAGDYPYFGWATLSVGKERSLLGVADTTVYLTTDDGVRAYDITDIEHPELLPYQATIEPFTGALRTIATSPRYLALVDDEGTLFLLPRDSPGTVGPLVVHTADYAPSPAEPPCSD
jgi:hypothetical protein